MKRRISRPQSLWRWLRRRVTGDVRVRAAALWLRAKPLALFQRRLAGRKMSSGEIGAMGELIAVRWLAANGRKVLHRNYRGGHRGEVDIVARHRDVLTFIEVKSRTSSAFGRPADAVGRDKQRLIQRGAMDWLRLLGNPRIQFRFDIAEVILTEGELPRVHIIENAFQMPDRSMAGR
ncbi:YraN family protein [Prosthecobacter sp.]|uniref:YraN family protein n=1 Tax=Prosthecobacter sp. TaxID=1965333 RepID=UPI002487A9E8|nr:YraN family protein [Prosthecobacter sp.]MDI1313836.1 YraN family protein [Prosthecobacter sp.]